MAGIIVGYAMIQKRKFYVRAIATGVLHMMAVAQLVVALYTFTAGIMLILTTVPLLLQAGTTYEGLSVMLVAILVSLLCEGLYMLTR